MSANVQQASMVSGRSLVFMVTAALHVAAISALMAWKISEANSARQADSIKMNWLEPDRPKPVQQPEQSRNVLATIRLVEPVNPVRPFELPDERPVITGQAETHDLPIGGEMDSAFDIFERHQRE